MYQMINQYFWVAAIATALMNVAILFARANPALEKSPELRPGFVKIAFGLATILVAPWFAMGIGILVGGVPGIRDYFDFRNGPYVVGWWLTNATLFLLTGIWLFAMNGAEKLEAHSVPFGRTIKAGAVKFQFGVLAFVTIVMIGMAATGSFPA